jgi:integrase
VAQVFAEVTRKNGKGAANGTAQIVRMVYNRELEAHEKDSWPRNPMRARTKLFKMHRLPPRQRVIPEDGFPAWADAVRSVENPLCRAGQLWLLLTGMRVNDVRTMRWEHITWEKTKSGERRAKDLFIPDPTGGKIRTYRLPLSPALATIINGLRIYATEAWAFPNTPWCFPCAGSKSRHIEEFKEHRRAVLINPHALRRTFATVAADVVPAKHISFLMNHALQKTMTDAYMALRPESLRRSQQAISGYIIEKLGATIEDILGPIHSGTKQTFGALPFCGRKGKMLAKRQAKLGQVVPIESRRGDVKSVV